MARFKSVTDEQILAMYTETGSGNEVAKRLGMCAPTVYAVLKQHAIPLVRRTGKRSVSDAAILEAYRHYRSGAIVARHLHVCDQTVYKVLADHGERATRRKFQGAQLEEVTARYQAGESATALAAAYRCSSAAVFSALRARQVPIRSSKIRLTAQEKAQALSLYTSGKTLHETAVALNRTDATIARFLHASHPGTVRPQHGFGPESKTWKGGTMVHHGYRYVLLHPSDPFAVMRSKAGYVLEHRIVMARKLGRPLRTAETVHHIDGNQLNNAQENLQIRHGKHGKGAVLCCGDCGSRNIVHAALEHSNG